MNKSIIALLACLALFTNCSTENKRSSDNQSINSISVLEERVEFISKNDTLVGYLSKPENLSRYPVVVVLHLASQGHHDNLLYNHLEKTLNEIGVGVFTYDRRGSGESGGNFETASFIDLADDAIEAIKLLKIRDDIKGMKVGLFGVSQGGWLAPIVHSLNKTEISFMTLVSSCGVSPSKQMEYSAVTTLKMNNYSDDEIAKAVHLITISDEYYRGKIERNVVQSELDKYKKENWFDLTHLDQDLPEDVSLTKWILEMDFEPKTYFESINIPIALFYGEFDRWIPIQSSIDVWEKALGITGNNNYNIYRIKNSGHLMILNEDSNPEEEIISEEYSLLLQEWVKSVI